VSVEIREPNADEAAQIADLLNDHAQASFGETEIAEAEVRHWFTLPEIWIRVAEREGQLVGYVDSVPRGKDDATELDVRTLDPESAELLLRTGEERAGTPLVRVVVQGDDPVLRKVVEASGWRPVRRSYQMRIELDGDLPEPSWPDGISVRQLQPEDERLVYEANNVAFAEDWHFRRQPFERWRDDNFGRENFDHSLSWLAEDGEQLAGFSVNSWHFSGDPEFGWVGILGVAPESRRRGLGTALLHQSFLEFRTRGAKRVGLGVDAENVTGAVRLYERAGMHVHRLNVTYEKALS
jgi:mycothiol synthase